MNTSRAKKKSGASVFRLDVSLIKSALVLLMACLFILSSYTHAQSVEELERIAGRAKSLDEFLGNRELQEEYYSALKAYFHRARFRCESYERIIEKVKALSAKVPAVKSQLWEKLPEEKFTVKTYPNPDDKLAAPGVMVNHTFRTFPRRFHAVFSDPAPHGCVSDNCKENDAASPDRWVSVLKDTKLYVLERNGIFTDQSVLVTVLSKNQKSFPLVSTTGGASLARPLEAYNGKKKRKYKTTMIAEWMDYANQNRPKHWEKFVALQHDDFERPSLKEEGNSHFIGETNEFAPKDALAKKVSEALPRMCLAKVDGVVSNGLDLFVGQLTPTGTNISSTVSYLAGNNTSLITEPGAALVNPDATRGLAQMGEVENSENTIPNVQSLVNVYQNDPDPAKRRQAAQELQAMGIDPKQYFESGRQSPSTLTRGKVSSGLDSKLAKLEDDKALSNAEKLLQSSSTSPSVLKGELARAGKNGSKLGDKSGSGSNSGGPTAGSPGPGFPNFPNPGQNNPGNEPGGGGGGGGGPMTASQARQILADENAPGWRRGRAALNLSSMGKLTPEEGLAVIKDPSIPVNQKADLLRSDKNAVKILANAGREARDNVSLKNELNSQAQRLLATAPIRCEKPVPTFPNEKDFHPEVEKEGAKKGHLAPVRAEFFALFLSMLIRDAIADHDKGTSSTPERQAVQQTAGNASRERSPHPYQCTPNSGEKPDPEGIPYSTHGDPPRLEEYQVMGTWAKPVEVNGVTTWEASYPDSDSKCIYMFTDPHGALYHGKLTTGSLATGTMLKTMTGNANLQDGCLYLYFESFKDGQPPGWVPLDCFDHSNMRIDMVFEDNDKSPLRLVDIAAQWKYDPEKGWEQFLDFFTPPKALNAETQAEINKARPFKVTPDEKTETPTQE